MLVCNNGTLYVLSPQHLTHFYPTIGIEDLDLLYQDRTIIFCVDPVESGKRLQVDRFSVHVSASSIRMLVQMLTSLPHLNYKVLTSIQYNEEKGKNFSLYYYYPNESMLRQLKLLDVLGEYKMWED